MSHPANRIQTALVSRPRPTSSGDIWPLAAVQPDRVGELVDPDESTIIGRLDEIAAMAKQEVQWIQIEGFTPDPSLILDHDFILLVCAEAWLRRVPNKGLHGKFWVSVNDTIATDALGHPGRNRLCGYHGAKFNPKPEWPTYLATRVIERRASTAEVPYTQLKVLLHLLRILHNAGYIVLERQDRQRLQSFYFARPSLRGLARAKYLADRIGHHLPILGKA